MAWHVGVMHHRDTRDSAWHRTWQGACACSTATQVVSYRECCLQGSDLVLGGYDVTSASECCFKCSEHKQCQFWTYGTKGKKKGKCWVKSDGKSSDARQNRWGTTSGDRESGYYDPCEDKTNRIDNNDYVGSDLVKGGFSNTTPDKCCAHCIATMGCKYWVFGKDNNKCWVKADTRGSQKKPNRMSGTFVKSLPSSLPPTLLPSLPPSLPPSLQPTLQPSWQPSLQPSLQPLVAASSIVRGGSNVPPPSQQSPLSQPAQPQPGQAHPAQPSGASKCCLACSGHK